MLGKLFKYDMRALSRVCLPMVVLSLILTALGVLSMRVLAGFDSDEVLNMIVGFTLGSFTGIAFIAAISLFVAGNIITYIRFYRNLFTNEGYLTFTLPVNSGQIYYSKLFSSLIWIVITGAVSVGELSLLVSVATAGSDQFSDFTLVKSFWEAFFNLFYLASGERVGIVIGGAIGGVLMFVQNLTTALFAIVLGSVIAKAHKFIAAVGMYFAISSAASTLTAAVSFILYGSGGFANSTYVVSAYANVILTDLLRIAIIFAEISLATILMRKKLNLQ